MDIVSATCGSGKINLSKNMNNKIKNLNKLEIQRFIFLCILLSASIYLYIKTGDDFGSGFVDSLK